MVVILYKYISRKYFSSDELIKQLKDSNATMIYTIKDLLPVTKEAIKELPHVVSNKSMYNLNLNTRNCMKLTPAKMW